MANKRVQVERWLNAEDEVKVSLEGAEIRTEAKYDSLIIWFMKGKELVLSQDVYSLLGAAIVEDIGTLREALPLVARSRAEKYKEEIRAAARKQIEEAEAVLKELGE